MNVQYVYVLYLTNLYCTGDIMKTFSFKTKKYLHIVQELSSGMYLASVTTRVPLHARNKGIESSEIVLENYADVKAALEAVFYPESLGTPSELI